MSPNTFKMHPLTRVATLLRARMFQCSLVAIVVVVVSADTSWAQQRYPMVCRGGAGIYLSLNHNEGGSIGGNSINNNLILSFRKSPWASFLGLQPGECAWSDRALASSEPSLMCVSGVSVNIVMSTQENGYLKAFTYTNNTSSANAVATKAVEGLLYNSQYQTFWVYNDRQGCLRP
jgi:hypothetical protein